ncbi:hypothetical protein [Phaeocystidibacter luteus]|uniref:Uncharacterized protein n=1 Tax=Phaeocystidibacter luteus TaxID=911197 RepID=A0A6N6RGT6_9FLAO|nr:hypothetical protein [Phaeocystidibacter luteus]KAB2808049.1 hypothetical protein F8C67_10785 [Phaeocystidibacter luteus]
MKNVIYAIRAALLVLAGFLAYKTYRVVMEPIEFERIEKRRFADVITSLEDIREAQKLYKQENGQYTGDLDVLIGYVDTGMVDIRTRKDSSFMRYNEVYRTDMNVDTVIYRTIGTESVKERLFTSEYNAEARMRYIPYSDNVEFEMDASVIDRNGVEVPVFEVKAGYDKIYHDLIAKGQYAYFIDENAELIIGSLTEPTLSGNWK